MPIKRVQIGGLMTRYTKKPVTVEAVQFTGENWQEIQRFVPDSVRIYDMNGFRIKTLEGEMKVNTGDFIIKGVKGEFYPCKPDIFQQTYIREGKTNVKPKACPFCGAEEITFCEDGPFKTMICLMCGAKGPLGHNDSQAVIWWNGRAVEE